MKRILTVFLCMVISLVLLTPAHKQKVSAYTAACTGYWVGMVKSATSVTKVGCVDSYSEGITLMNKQTSTSSSVASLFKDDTIVASRYATLDFTAVGSSSVNSYIYARKTDGTFVSTADYFNGYYTAEGPYITTGSTASKAVTVISGLFGRVNRTRNSNTQYEIVPISVSAPKNYYVKDSNGNMKHYFAYFSSQSSLSIGVAPDFMETSKKYYSYDGHYFYTSYIKMIDDYNAGVFTNAVNADSPWYNYYQFISFHSTTNYTASDIDRYMRAKGYTHPAYTYYSKSENGQSTYPTSTQSLLYSTGSYFMQMQQIYGINPMLLLSIGINESSWGRSYISIVKNNLFGMAAYDSSTSSATKYASTLDSILDVAKVLTSSYFNAASDTNYYYGAILGNKETGVNVKYASDAYWGEKAASHYYSMDKYLGFKDYNSYTIGITNKESVKAYASASTSTTSYIYNGVSRVLKNNSVLIVGESGNYYKVMADYSLGTAKDWTTGEFNTKYDLENNYVYVKKSDITVVNAQSTYNKPTNSDHLNSIRIEYLDEYYPLQVKNDSTLYYDAYQETLTEVTVKKDTYLCATERAYNSKGDVMYRVIYNYGNGKMGWVKASDVTEISASYAKKYNSTHDAIVASVYASASTSAEAVGSVKYNGMAVTIIKSKTVSGKVWYYVCYNASSSGFGWTLASEFKSAVAHEAPEVVEPSDPEPTDPEPTDPEPTDPEPTDPVDPEPTDPEPTDPVDPTPTDPVDPTPVDPVDPTPVDPVDPTPVDPVDPTPTDPVDPTPDTPASYDVSQLTSKSNMWYLHKVALNESKTALTVQGLLAIEGITNAPTTDLSFFIELTNQITSEIYYIPLERWTATEEYPYNINDVPGVKKDYSGAWFTGEITFAGIPSGNYTAYVVTKGKAYYSKQILCNTYSIKMDQRFTNVNGSGIELRTNYLLRSLPIDVLIRSEGLISAEPKSATDNAFVEYSTMSLADGKFNIRGTAFTVGGSYPKDASIDRTMILENTTTYQRYSTPIGSTSSGDYPVTLRVDDKQSKASAWFDASVDVKDLPVGTYAIYITTTSANGITDYGELADSFARSISSTMTYNGKTYTLSLNKSQRNRIELIVSE